MENKSETNYRSQCTEAFVTVQKEKEQKTGVKNHQGDSNLSSIKKSLAKTDLLHSGD